ncbi:MAG TPA: polysaccharide biosynthesis tyrosine autokinase [Anaerolineales bacterium]|nr:polysaccharide biosynthesis tyrosine autokinase [Anaerolineales bacterium]
MELSKYIFPLRKWWWLLVASTLVAAIFSSLSILRQPTIYQARTTLMIGMTINNPNPSSNELLLGQQLAAAYADLANREMVLNATKNALAMDQLPEYIARALPNTQLIEITVNDIDPQRAQTVANELSAQLILLSPTNAPSEEQGRQEFIHQRLNNLEAQINETESQIEKLQVELANTYSAQEINAKQTEISSLQSKLDTMENNYGLLLSNTQKGAINTLTIIEPADLPSRPIGPRKGLSILLAAAVGFILAACEAYLLEFLNDTMKSADDVERLFSAPIIGRIFEQIDKKDGENQLFDADDLRHPIADAFRGLRTNIEITQADRPLKTILVTSPDIGDGKTSVAANLALSLAQRDKEVILLDVDLRRPNIHKFFGLDNDRGLVDLISDGAAISDVLQFKNGRKVGVLTSGEPPLKPTEILSSKKMDQLLSKLQETADVVIIDGPPFIVADAMVMASKVDGVIVVVRPGHTRRSLALGALEQIKLTGSKVVGVVLNRIPLHGADYYAGKSYLYTYYSSTYGDALEGREKKLELEKLMESLLAYSNKATNFVKYLFKVVFKLSPK